MTEPARLPAALAYIPLIGWVYVFIFQRKNPLAVFHLRQSIGLILFLIAALAGWAIVAWLLAWLPLMGAVAAALFALVMAAYFYGVIAWILGIINAFKNRMSPLPGFGKWASRLPIG